MTNDAAAYGLSPATILQINAIFAAHPEIEQVLLYGSRAKGNYRPGSDIDLCITGTDITLSELTRIETEIDDLLLPYKIDLSVRNQIENEELIAHIERVGVTFYRRSN